MDVGERTDAGAGAEAVTVEQGREVVKMEDGPCCWMLAPLRWPIPLEFVEELKRDGEDMGEDEDEKEDRLGEAADEEVATAEVGWRCCIVAV
jgi:hypothetical protein